MRGYSGLQISSWRNVVATASLTEAPYGQKIETARRRQRSNVCWCWAGVAQQACRGRLSRDDGGRKQFWVRRSAQQFQCSMAVLELLARATEAWVVAAGNEHLVNRSSRIVDGVSRRCTAGKPVRMDVASGWRYQFYERLMSRIGILVSLD